MLTIMRIGWLWQGDFWRVAGITAGIILLLDVGIALLSEFVVGPRLGWRRVEKFFFHW